MTGEPVKPVLMDCRRCNGKGWEPSNQFKTCGGCAGSGCHTVDPWPAGRGVFYWPQKEDCQEPPTWAAEA